MSGSFDESGAEQGHHRQRHRVGREQRQRHGKRQRREQVLADAVQESDREKYNHRGQRSGEHGQSDFATALFRGHRRLLAHFQMAIDVFEHHHRVVDEAGKRQRQPSQHHGVDGVSSEREGDKGRQRGKWNREEHGHGGPHAAQKHQDHDGRQDQADPTFVK